MTGELVVYVGNCPIGGHEKSICEGGSWCLNIINPTIDGKSFQIRQDPEYIRAVKKPDLRGEFACLTTFHFQNVDKEKIPDFLDFSEKICELLSFATESRVIAYGHDFPKEGVMCQRRSAVGSVETFRPPFTLFLGGEIKHFIETCYPKFSMERARRQLNVVFDYIYHASKSNQAEEIKLTTLFLLLENLKHSFATAKGYPYLRGYFRPFGSTAVSLGRKLTFEFLLSEMFQEVSMNPSMTRIIQLRNELIHSGLLAIGHNEKFELFEEIQDIIREYILRLLNFKGTYNCYKLMQTMTLH